MPCLHEAPASIQPRPAGVSALPEHEGHSPRPAAIGRPSRRNGSERHDDAGRRPSTQPVVRRLCADDPCAPGVSIGTPGGCHASFDGKTTPRTGDPTTRVAWIKTLRLLDTCLQSDAIGRLPMRPHASSLWQVAHRFASGQDGLSQATGARLTWRESSRGVRANRSNLVSIQSNRACG